MPRMIAQSASVDFTSTVKELYGSFQLPLAIGRNGLNVHLAAKLTGWNIDLLPERR